MEVDPIGASVIRADLACRIEHTLLTATAAWSDLRRLTEEASRYRFHGVCVASANVRRCRLGLGDAEVRVVAVIGFPLGAVSTAAKQREAEQALVDGAEELDVVIHLGALKSQDYQRVFDDLRAVVLTAGSAPVKAILETCALERDEKLVAGAVSVAAGVAFLKTSTGFGSAGATVEDVALLRAAADPSVEIKASGGVRTAVEADALIAAGASRIGTSRGVELVTGSSGERPTY